MSYMDIGTSAELSAVALLAASVRRSLTAIRDEARRPSDEDRRRLGLAKDYLLGVSQAYRYVASVSGATATLSALGNYVTFESLVGNRTSGTAPTISDLPGEVQTALSVCEAVRDGTTPDGRQLDAAAAFFGRLAQEAARQQRELVQASAGMDLGLA
jgi:hypothetical protein